MFAKCNTDTKKKEDLNIEKVKSFKGFENISDKEASTIAETIKEFCLLSYECYLQYKEQKTIHKEV